MSSRAIHQPQPQATTAAPHRRRWLGPARIKTPATPRPHAPYAFWHGVGAAFVGALITLVPTLLAWVLDKKSSSSGNDAFGVGLDLWALAHRAHLSTDGVSVVISPLMLTFLFILLVRLASRRAFPVERLSPRDLTIVLGSFVIGYLIAAQAIGLLSSIGPARVGFLSLIVGPLIVALTGVVWTLWEMRDHSPEVSQAHEKAANAAPLLMRRAIVPALSGLRWLGVATAVILLILIAWHGGRVWMIHSQLAPGAVGGTLLVIAQLMMLPNILTLIAAWLAGSPVSVGAVQIGQDSVHTAALPLVPVLGALPDTMVSGGWAFLGLLIPLAVGAHIGWDSVDHVARLSSIRTKLLVAGSAAVFASLALLLLLWFSTVSISQGLLPFVGASWSTLVLFPLEFVLPALAVAGVRHWGINHRH